MRPILFVTAALLLLVLLTLIPGSGGAAHAVRPDGYAWRMVFAPGQGDWPRWSVPVVAFEDKLWAIEASAPQKTAFASADGVRWSRTASEAAWGERYRPAVVFFKGKLWLLGGRSGTVENPTYHNDVWASENGTDWKLVAAAAGWTPRWDHTALLFGDKLWVMGGFGSVGPLSPPDIWFTSDGVNWTRAAEQTPWSRWKYRSFVVFRDRIWAIGFHAGNDVWSTRDGVHWERATADTGWPASSRSKHAVVFDGRIWVMGGSDAKGDFENDVWFSTDGAGWRQAQPAPWFPRVANYSVVFRERLWIFGGKNGRDDVWALERAR